MKYLQSKDIPCAIYYPIPLHKKAYLDARQRRRLPVTNQLVKEVISSYAYGVR
jgi:hypothetical protein